ncbi:hypothetical protein [Merismopedia glauca]|uniref:Lipoprotein n=1 Tax=Merismopedia glauca CCAP 1448/3 TaxID=1296344 RepID=A0A2T1BYG1_9CYAN|nr:hypothetical protein [Merismopedia glauca]PSB00957.1 hypothetical protein C7B64_20835 [Merismopedia glauca CCAP 1448/3]
MKLKTRALPIVILLSSFTLNGCGNQAAKVVREGVETISQKGDDVARKTTSNGEQIPTQIRRRGTEVTETVATKNGNRLINYIKKEVRECAEQTRTTVIKQTINNAINSNLSQISVESLLQIAANKIKECSLYKMGSILSEAGESIYAAFNEEVSEAAASSVIAAELEYRGQILFVSN